MLPRFPSPDTRFALPPPGWRAGLWAGLLGVGLLACGRTGPAGRAEEPALTPRLADDSRLLTGTPVYTDRHALLIGIAHYRDPGWEPLHAYRNLELIRATLLRQGFRPDHIHTLRDEQATHAGIRQAFENLRGQLRSGQKALVYFTGHGDQLPDDNGDELDGQDEALVPYDAPVRHRQPGYAGAQHLRDDELNALVGGLRNRTGPAGHVLLLFESCHAGTAVRGMWGRAQRSRGTVGRPRRAGRPHDGYDVVAGTGSYVLLASTTADQTGEEILDEEGLPIGPLTQAFCRTLAGLRPAESYQSFFERIYAIMARTAPRQKPAMEGQTQQAVLGGTTAPAMPSFRVFDEGALVLNGGLLHGLTPGSRVGFYPDTTQQPRPAARLASGMLSDVGTLRSLVTVPAGTSRAALLSARVFVEALQPGATTTRLLVGQLDPTHRAQVAQWPAVVLTDAPNAADRGPTERGPTEPRLGELRLDQRGGFLELRTQPDGRLLCRSRDLDACRVALRQYRHRQQLLNLDLSDPDYAVALSMQRVAVRQRRGQTLVTDTLPSPLPGRVPVLRASARERALLTLRNTGQRVFYLTVVDLQPDGQLRVLLPEADQSAVEYRLRPGQQLTRRLRVSAPYGTELYKVFLTPEPIDLRPYLLAYRSQPPAGHRHPFEQLVSQLTDSNRGVTDSRPPLVPLRSGATLTYAFTISP